MQIYINSYLYISKKCFLCTLDSVLGRCGSGDLGKQTNTCNKPGVRLSEGWTTGDWSVKHYSRQLPAENIRTTHCVGIWESPVSAK